MHDEIFVANESLEELRSLRQVVQDLVIFGEARSKFVKQLVDLQVKEQLEKIEIQQLKFVLSIRLQKLMLTFTFPKRPSVNMIAAAYDRIIGIWQQIDGKLHMNEKIVHLKIIQTLLDYKIGEKYGIGQKFCYQELLPIIEEHLQFENLYSNKDEEYEMLFLGLVIEFMRKQEIENYLEMHTLAVNFIKQKLQKLKKEIKSNTHQSVVKQLLVLLHLHLSYKLLRKHFKFQDQNADQSVYILLYDLQYSLTQKVTIQYKRYYAKTAEEAIAFSASKIKSFIVDLQSGLDFDNDLLQTKTSRKLSAYRIKRPSRSLNDWKKRLSNQNIKSLKKLEQKRLQIRNQIYVPEKASFNKKLQHKIQYKAQKAKKDTKKDLQRSRSQISIKSIKYPERQPNRISDNKIKMQFTISKDQIGDTLKESANKQEQKISYMHCIRNIRTPTQQLQQMLCLRPSNNIGQISLVSSKAKEDELSNANVIVLKRNRSKLSLNRRISHNYSSIRTVEDKLEVINDIGKCHHSTLYVPPLIKKNLFRYIKAFLVFASYQQKRKEIPFYMELSSLDPKKDYYLLGNIFQFYSANERSLVFNVHLLLNKKHFRKIFIDLKKMAQIRQVQQQFVRKKSMQSIYQMFYLGKDISLFKLNIKAPTNQLRLVKHQVNSIKYEYQIYSYSVYINTRTDSKSIVKKILSKQQEYMDRINKQLEIRYDYNQQVKHGRAAQQRCVDSNALKFYQFFHQKELQMEHNVILIQCHTKSLKYLKTFSIFYINLYKCTDRQKYYLIMKNKNGAKLVIVCKRITIKEILKEVRTLCEFKKSILTKDKLYYECWSDVLLNKTVLEPRLKKYCVRGQIGYKVYSSKVLIENQLKLIYGIHNEMRWFVFISLLEIEPVWLKTLPNSRQRKIKSTRSFKSIKKQAKGHEVGIELCLMQHFKNARIINQELHLNKEIYRYSVYEDHWIYYQNRKRHYCFRQKDRIQYFTITQNQLMYINTLKLGNTSSKDSIFDEFRSHLSTNYTILKVVLFQIGKIVMIRCDADRLVCTFEYQDVEQRIQLDRSEFTLFHQEKIVMNENLLHQKSFRKRLMGIVKEKILENREQKY